MPSLKPAFDTAASDTPVLVSSLIWHLWAIAILEDDAQRDKDAARKTEQHRKAELLRKGTVPRPF